MMGLKCNTEGKAAVHRPPPMAPLTSEALLACVLHLDLTSAEESTSLRQDSDGALND